MILLQLLLLVPRRITLHPDALIDSKMIALRVVAEGIDPFCFLLFINLRFLLHIILLLLLLVGRGRPSVPHAEPAAAVGTRSSMRKNRARPSTLSGPTAA